MKLKFRFTCWVLAMFLVMTSTGFAASLAGENSPSMAKACQGPWERHGKTGDNTGSGRIHGPDKCRLWTGGRQKHRDLPRSGGQNHGPYARDQDASCGEYPLFRTRSGSPCSEPTPRISSLSNQDPRDSDSRRSTSRRNRFFSPRLGPPLQADWSASACSRWCPFPCHGPKVPVGRCSRARNCTIIFVRA